MRYFKMENVRSNNTTIDRLSLHFRKSQGDACFAFYTAADGLLVYECSQSLI